MTEEQAKGTLGAWAIWAVLGALVGFAVFGSTRSAAGGCALGVLLAMTATAKKDTSP